MWIVNVHEYDYFTGNNIKQHRFENRKDAEEKYEQERTKDFDYGDHYRKTTIFKTES